MMLFGVEKSKIVRQEARFCGVIPIAHLKAPVQIVRCCFCCLYYTIPKMSSGAKLQDEYFKGDIIGLIRPDEAYDQDKAYELIKTELLEKCNYTRT